MHLRSSQLLQLQNILEELGLDTGDLTWRKAPSHLPNSLPTAVLEGHSLYSQSLGYFFTIGQPWHLYWSPSGEDRFSEAVSVGGWSDAVNLFRDWAGQLKREVEEGVLWPEKSGPEHARPFLQRSQMNALYRRLQDRGMPADLGTWSGGELSARFQVSN